MFKSILFDTVSPSLRETPPDFFADLNLDQVVEGVATRVEDYDIRPFFYSPLRDVELIRYRQAIMRDLEDEAILKSVKEFSRGMRAVRRYTALSDKLMYEYHKMGWFLEAVWVYVETVRRLQETLSRLSPGSRGFADFKAYITEYTTSPEFITLAEEARRIKDALNRVEYVLIIKSGKVSVKRYEGEPAYTPEIEEVFEKFRQGDVRDYRVDMRENGGMDHVEARILEFVARLFPEPFAALRAFYDRYHGNFFDAVLARFDEEVQFYVAYLEFIREIRRKGLPFSYPEIDVTGREEEVKDGFDVALAYRLLHSDTPVICNDVRLRGEERILVVTGPNQGGKTTFARMVGQLHYLAGLGVPVPARYARLFLPDRIFTHFEREEDVRNLRGKLQDDLIRIHDILVRATGESLIILNEIFASTTLEDATFLGKRIMEQLQALDALCVWVTFVDELARSGGKVVSMVSMVDPQRPEVRTFKIVRRAADGLAYALSIVRKHGLTYEQIVERIPS